MIRKLHSWSLKSTRDTSAGSYGSLISSHESDQLAAPKYSRISARYILPSVLVRRSRHGRPLSSLSVRFVSFCYPFCAYRNSTSPHVVERNSSVAQTDRQRCEKLS